MLDYGFYNSTEYTMVDGVFPQGNKAKDASFMAAFISAFISSGISPSYTNSFLAVTGDGLNITRLSGEAIGEGTYLRDTDSASFQLVSGADNYHYFRFDAALGQVTEGVYVNPPAGTFPLRAGDVYELITAKITVPQGATQVTAGMITDLRADDAMCGFMRMRAGVEFENMGITADDISNTGNTFIPRFGKETQVVKGSGVTSQLTPVELTGNLKGSDEIGSDGTAGDFVFRSSDRHVSNPLLIPKAVAGAGFTNQQNMYTNVFSGTYAYISITSSTTQDFYLVYDVMDIPAGAKNIKIEVRLSANRGGVASASVTAAMNAFNIDAGADIPDTLTNVRLNTYLNSPDITRLTLTYAKSADMPTRNIGLRVKASSTSSSSGTLNIYGSDISYEYDDDENETVRFDKTGLFMGRYSRTYDYGKGATVIKEWDYSRRTGYGIPESYEIVQGSGTNPGNMLNDVTNGDVYAQFTYAPSSANAPKFYLKIADMPVIPPHAVNVTFTIAVRMYAGNLSVGYLPAVYPYNELTGEVLTAYGFRITVSNTAGGVISTYTAVINMNALPNAPLKLGLYIDCATSYSGNATLQVYGANLTADYEIEEKLLARLTDSGNFIAERWINALMGNYSFIANGANVDFIYSNRETPQLTLAKIASSFVNKSGSNISASNIANMYNPVTNESYMTLTNTNSVSDAIGLTFVCGFAGIPYIDSKTTNIIVTARIRIQRVPTSSGTRGKPVIALYDMDTGKDIPNMEQSFQVNGSMGTPELRQYNFAFGSFDEINFQNLGFRIFFYMEKGEQVRVYGAEMIWTYSADGRVIGKLTPDGMVTGMNPVIETLLGVGGND